MLLLRASDPHPRCRKGDGRRIASLLLGGLHRRVCPLQNPVPKGCLSWILRKVACAFTDLGELKKPCRYKMCCIDVSFLFLLWASAQPVQYLRPQPRLRAAQLPDSLGRHCLPQMPTAFSTANRSKGTHTTACYFPLLTGEEANEHGHGLTL